MVRLFLIALLFQSFVAGADSQRFSVYSEILGEDITVQVSLPDTYHHSDNFKYPVLIVLDGSTQFSHIAGSVHFLSTYAIIPEMIVVGVATPTQRLTYYTHTEPEAFAGRSGQAGLYTRFLQDELHQALTAKYRLAPYSVISGHSLSGLYTSYLALTGESAFNAAISVSPSLWWDGSTLIKHYAQSGKAESQRPIRWFLSMASEPGEMQEAFSEMLDSLNAHPSATLEWSHAIFADDTHDSTPLVANAKGLQAIFTGWNAVPEITVMPLNQLQSFYQAKTAEYGYHFAMSVHQYNVYGLKAAYENQAGWGVAILEQGVKDFPASEILWDSLATAYALHDALPKALAASEQAVALAIKHNSIFSSEIMAQNEKLKTSVVK